MIPEYTFRLLTAADLPALDSLFELSFKQPVRAGHFRWKYFENPYGDAIIAGAFDGALLVASCAMIPEELSIKGNIARICKITELMTHPAHQKRGLAKKINELLDAELTRQNILLDYAMSTPLTTKILLRNDWQYIRKIGNYFKPYPLLALSNLFRFKRPSGFEDHVGVGALLDSFPFTKSNDKIQICKTSASMRWRTANPNYVYHTLLHHDVAGVIDGYLLYSISPNSLIAILEFESTDGEAGRLALLHEIERIAAVGKHKGILLIALLDSPLAHYARQRGYIRNPFKHGPMQSNLDFIIRLNVSTHYSLDTHQPWEINAFFYDDI